MLHAIFEGIYSFLLLVLTKYRHLIDVILRYDICITISNLSHKHGFLLLGGFLRVLEKVKVLDRICLKKKTGVSLGNHAADV